MLQVRKGRAKPFSEIQCYTERLPFKLTWSTWEISVKAMINPRPESQPDLINAQRGNEIIVLSFLGIWRVDQIIQLDCRLRGDVDFASVRLARNIALSVGSGSIRIALCNGAGSADSPPPSKT